MFCSNCGDPIENNEKFCNKCGNKIDNLQNINNLEINSSSNNNTDIKNQNIKMILIGVGIGTGILLVIITCLLVFNNNNYFFSKNDYKEKITNTSNTKKTKGKYSTVIITDNTYSGVKINTEKDAYNLIEKDSVSQKDSCPQEIREVENNIIKKYGITAVNLCEMNVDFAKEIATVFNKIYDEYPTVRGYITNLSLVNATMSENYIAAFMPIFNFATSDSVSGYPWIIKTQVLLNTSYFLNQERLELTIKDSSNSGHFPKNATIYSPIAHELGHYLSFLALMNSYNTESILLVDNNELNNLYTIYDNFGDGKFSLSMIQEAYDNYKKDTNTTLDINEWRRTISNYAVAKDNSGNYIYDETIAEAFHDVYLNEEKACDASKYVVKVLKEKLGEL